MVACLMPEIDHDKCTGCDLCVRHCPHQALAMAGGRLVVSAPDNCDYCGICQDICPTTAINLVYEIVWEVNNDENKS